MGPVCHALFGTEQLLALPLIQGAIYSSQCTVVVKALHCSGEFPLSSHNKVPDKSSLKVIACRLLGPIFQ